VVTTLVYVRKNSLPNADNCGGMRLLLKAKKNKKTKKATLFTFQAAIYEQLNILDAFRGRTILNRILFWS